MRDILIREVPAALREGLYAIPAVIGASIAVAGGHSPVAAVGGAVVCFGIRALGIAYDLNAPQAALNPR
jgi:uncharacterized membrane protein YeiH